METTTNEVTKLVTSTECMPEDAFWAMVEMVKWPCDYDKAKIKYLKVMTKDEAMKFRQTKGAAMLILCKVADEIENLGVSDDGYSDLTNHIVGLGKVEFYKHVNNPELIKKLAHSFGYKESYAYCIPYESDYDEGGNSYFTMAHVEKMAKESRAEILRFLGMDNKSYLEDIEDDLCKINNLMIQFLGNPSEAGLKTLIKQEKFVKDACKRIDKFFSANRMELPRKFTDGNGFCNALIENTIHDAKLALEFLFS